jgi:hypothetical protein
MSTGTRSAHTYLTIGIAAVAAFLVVACKKAAPPDGVCTYEQLPAGAEVPSGQGGIQVLASTDAAANLQAGSVLELKPGTVNVDAGTDEYYAVLDAATKQLASSHGGRALGLFAGSYTVRINNTDAKADVRAGESTNVPSGTLVVHGSTDEYYAVVNSAGVQLASAHLEKPLAFVLGTYNVKVNNTTTPATIASGVTTEVTTGTVVLQGSTDEYCAIVDSAGTQLASRSSGAPAFVGARGLPRQAQQRPHLCSG